MCSWCFLRACTALIVLSTGLCQDSSTQPAKDQPVRDVYVAVGSEVKLLCGGAAGGEQLDWRLNGVLVTSGSLLHLRSMYAPSTPDIRCWAPSYPMKALCTWSQTSDTYLPTQYIVTYRDGQSGTIYPCHIMGTSDSFCEMRNLEAFAIKPYIVNITAINPLGRATKLMQFDLEQSVKPDPPVNVRAVASRGRRVLVEWGPPPSWPDPLLFPLKYKVRYSWDSQGVPRPTVEVEAYESSRISLDNLKVGRTYHFQVSAHDQLDHGTGSDWSQPANATVVAR